MGAGDLSEQHGRTTANDILSACQVVSALLHNLRDDPPSVPRFVI